jgi:hypothetical protein
VLAPEGTIVNTCPAQIEPLFTTIVGLAKTVTLETAVFEDTHPAVLVPVTEYEVLLVGLTVLEPFEYV